MGVHGGHWMGVHGGHWMGVHGGIGWVYMGALDGYMEDVYMYMYMGGIGYGCVYVHEGHWMDLCNKPTH